MKKNKFIQILLWPFKAVSKGLAAIMLGMIRLYQWTLSPLIGKSCRFTPTCSNYGLEAIRKYGPFKGGWLTLKRICRCNPWGGSGYDPVP